MSRKASSYQAVVKRAVSITPADMVREKMGVSDIE
jgi:hypothetical protein